MAIGNPSPNMHSRLTITTRPRYFGRMTDNKKNNNHGEKKAEQLSAALRANLAKRKQQARARKEPAAPATPEEKD